MTPSFLDHSPNDEHLSSNEILHIIARSNHASTRSVMRVKNDGTRLRTIQSWANRTRPKDAVRLKSRGRKRNKWHQIHHRPPFTAVPPLRSPERTVMPTRVPETAPRLEPPQRGGVEHFDEFLRQRTLTGRKAGSSASSYWSVPEARDFPYHLSAFGSDWVKLAAYMGTKTSVMVKNYYLRQKENGENDWEKRVREADKKRSRGEKLPPPPHPNPPIMGRFDTVPLLNGTFSDTTREGAPPPEINSPAVVQPTFGSSYVPAYAQPPQEAILGAVPPPAQSMHGASGSPSPHAERPRDNALVNVVRAISRDNTAGNDHKRSQCMATLGLKHNKIRSSGS